MVDREKTEQQKWEEEFSVRMKSPLRNRGGGKLLIEELAEVLTEKLTPREVLVVRLSEGLDDGTRHPQAEIGGVIGRSRWTVGRIKRGVLDKLKSDPFVQERLRAHLE